MVQEDKKINLDIISGKKHIKSSEGPLFQMEVCLEQLTTGRKNRENALFSWKRQVTVRMYS